MQNRRLLTLDQATIIAKARELASKVKLSLRQQ
jgi:hypothetical protein